MRPDDRAVVVLQPFTDDEVHREPRSQRSGSVPHTERLIGVTDPLQR